MNAPVYNQQGEKISTVELPEQVFGLPWNADLVHQVITSMQANLRRPIAHTKDRGTVRGGGKKPWQQKGTGRARHGSRRSPIWIGGGVTHGPSNEKVYAKKINKKMRQKALWTILAKKQKEGEVVWLDELNLTAPKTKLAAQVLKQLSTVTGLEKINYKKGARALVAFPTLSVATKKSFNNLPATRVQKVGELNPLETMRYKYVVMVEPENSLKALSR